MNISDIRKICVVGAGTMGSQIAQQCALAGYQVVLNDVKDDLLEKAVSANRSLLSKRVAKGTMSSEEMEAALKRVTPVADLEKAAGDADFVIEAAFERLDVKHELFGRLDAICPPRTILASNSSTMQISRIAEGIQRKDKACNMHFFHPVLMMELVEVVKGKWTSDETVQITYDLTKKIGRTPVLVTKEVCGFIVNRILIRLMAEAFWLAENGYAKPEDIDLAIKLGLRHPMGPFELADFSGVDVVRFASEQIYEDSHDEHVKPARVLSELVEAGRLGRKTGKGFYDYTKS